MDDRTRRIGEHASDTEPAWAISSLGKPPIDPAGRQRWQQRAAAIGACRELYGHDSRTDAIGPEPARSSPEAWAGWHAAFAALDRIGGLDLRGASDAQLRLRRATCQRELTWAPPHVAEELRLARLQARTAREHATRAEHAAPAATSPQAAARHRELARVWHAMHAKATTIAATLADAQETRRQWTALTNPTRTMALAADLELRRRHPNLDLEPLSGAEPAQAATSPGDAEWIRQAFTVTATAGKVPGQPIQDLETEPIPSRSPDASRPLALAELDIDAEVADRGRTGQMTAPGHRGLRRYPRRKPSRATALG